MIHKDIFGNKINMDDIICYSAGGNGVPIEFFVVGDISRVRLIAYRVFFKPQSNSWWITYNKSAILHSNRSVVLTEFKGFSNEFFRDVLGTIYQRYIEG